jgi:RHS repeat-associated protein
MENHEATGLLLAVYRNYDPQLGRWISSDPIGLVGGLNRYRFVENNCANRVDPLGLFNSPDAAADAALSSIPSLPNAEVHEYGGRIYYDPGRDGYFFTPPRTDSDPNYVGIPMPPGGTVPSGFFHSHPPDRGPQPYPGPDMFSPCDLVAACLANEPAYLLNSSGGKKKWDPNCPCNKAKCAKVKARPQYYRIFCKYMPFKWYWS